MSRQLDVPIRCFSAALFVSEETGDCVAHLSDYTDCGGDENDVRGYQLDQWSSGALLAEGLAEELATMFLAAIKRSMHPAIEPLPDIQLAG